jgi:hypothetical protein
LGASFCTATNALLKGLLSSKPVVVTLTGFSIQVRLEPHDGSRFILSRHPVMAASLAHIFFLVRNPLQERAAARFRPGAAGLGEEISYNPRLFVLY